MTKMFVIIVVMVIAFLVYHFAAKTSTAQCPKLSGRVVQKGDASYDTSRLVSNYYTSKNKFPTVIVYCQNNEDVQNAVLWARFHKMPIRIRSGGHHHEGYSTGTGVVLIDVSEMKSLHIDNAQQSAIAQPGLNNGELYSTLFQHGLTHVGGTCSEVSLSGLVLSGGIGPLLRRAGLTCDSLIAFDMIDANGTLIHATKDNEHKDLFWATQGGGGGNFGIIVSLEIKVHPAEDVTWFEIGWDWQQPIEEVLAAWQHFFAQQDINWFSHLDLWARLFPAQKLHKSPIHAMGFFWGTPEDAREQLAPLLSIGTPTTQTFERVTWAHAIQAIEESTAVFLTDKPEYKSTGAYVMQPLPPEALKIIVQTLHNSTSPLLNVLLFSMGGATAHVGSTDTAYFYRDALFFINYSTQWLKEDEDLKHKIELTALRDKLMPFTVGNYVGNPDPDLADYLTTYYGSNVKRLECIKRAYDPENVFNFEQSLPLSTAPCE